MTGPNGLLVVDKPNGWTSHQVVARVRRLLGTRKVGHAGTLDPMATGVLVIGVGRATRLLGHLAGQDKTYTATIRLGQATDTDDADGQVVSADGAEASADQIKAAIASLTGPINQVPSTYSAIKVAGKRSYALARAGEKVELASRPVVVNRFELIEIRPTLAGEIRVQDLDVVVDCSSGTYIRALARDLGGALGVGGHLVALRRTRVGAFTESMISVDADTLASSDPPELIGMGEVASLAFQTVEVDAETAGLVAHGGSLGLDLPAELVAITHRGELLALYRRADQGARPVAVLVG